MHDHLPIPTARALFALVSSAGLLVVIGCQDAGPLDPAGSVTAQAQAGQVLAARSGEPAPVPYVGTLRTTSSVPAAPPPGCQLFLNTTQEGHASVLGHYTGVGTTCGYNGQMGVTDPPFSTTGGPPFFVSDFSVQQTHTASNGDQLQISGTGVFVQSLVDGSSATVGAGTIEGGTGRFAGASGSFSLGGEGGAPDTFDGWIAFDASQVSLP